MRAMWWPLFWPGVTFVATTLAAFAFRHALFAGFRRWTGHATRDSVVLTSIRLPSALWCVVLGLFVAIETVQETAAVSRRFTGEIGIVLRSAVILSVTITVAGVLGSLVAAASEKRSLGGGFTGLAQTSVRLLILVVGGLVLLASLGIEITPILTALGVGGLAVALALQDTLGNLFAGMHLLADRPIRVGDYVKLSAENVEGTVVDVGWRSTRLRMLNNNTVVVPNSKVAQSVITNYALPDPRMAVLIRVSVDLATDPDHLETALVQEAKAAVGEIPGLLADPAPAVRFMPGFGDSSLDFTLVCHVASFIDQFTAQHELRKRILRRLRAEGIAIPFPARTVYLRADGRAPLARPTS
jgi:small-conductance mechanosensitive channel